VSAVNQNQPNATVKVTVEIDAEFLIKLAVFAPLLIPGSEARRGSVLGHEIKIDSAVLISSG
jgi:hypothetical protein